MTFDFVAATESGSANQIDWRPAVIEDVLLRVHDGTGGCTPLVANCWDEYALHVERQF